MAINFCDDIVGTRIDVDQICADGYEVGNLINPTNRCGFMAEYFIKPPVSVVLTFPAPTEIGWIGIGLVRGPIKVTGLELWVSHTLQAEDDFVFLAKNYGSPDDAVWFANRSYVPRGPFTKLSMPLGEMKTKPVPQILRSTNCRLVCRLKIKVVRVRGSTSVGLGFCQVWGQPMSTCCNLALQRELILKSTSLRQPLISRASSATATSTAPSALQSCLGAVAPELEIPVDFQDALTCELMTQPVLLPSGQVVDQSTLDKHVESELKWGRPACDPFTGVPLSGDSKPLCLPELKSRIDHFVVRNLDKLGNIPRTIGTARLTVGEGPCVQKRLPSWSEGSIPNGMEKEKPRDESMRSTEYDRIPPLSVLGTSVKRKLHQSYDAALGTHLSTKVEHRSHEEQLALSLFSSLEETLGKIRRSSGGASVPQENRLCFTCKKEDATHSIPCGHRLCRLCLSHSVTRGRCLCNEVFLSSQVTRVHCTPDHQNVKLDKQ